MRNPPTTTQMSATLKTAKFIKVVSIVLVVIDQIVKIWVRSAIPLGQSIPFIPYLMDLTYTQNTGAAFSSFSSRLYR